MNQEDHNRLALVVACPICLAEAGASCRMKAIMSPPYVHAARILQANKTLDNAAPTDLRNPRG